MKSRLLLLIAALLAIGSELVAAPPETPFNGLFRPNGKQIARTSSQWLLVMPDASGGPARLLRAPLDVAAGKLDGWTSGVFRAESANKSRRNLGAWPVPPSMVVDPHGRLHVAWDDDQQVWYSTAEVPAAGSANGPAAGSANGPAAGSAELKLSPQAILTGARLGDIAVDQTGDVWIAAVVRNRDGSTTTGMVRGSTGWKFEEVASDIGFLPPVMQLADNGSAHVVWSDTRGRVLHELHKPGQRGEMKVLASGGYDPNGRNPAVIAHGRQLLVVYESLYNQVESLVLEDGKWSGVQHLTRADTRFAPDTLHSPQLALDRHGVVWLFFSDSTRRYTYFARWLGGQWSDIYDCRGIYYRSPRFEADLLATDWLAVEKYPPRGATSIGMALANSLAPEKNEFHAIDVPSPKATAGSGMLFLDLLEAADVRNLELSLDEAEKDPNNPLLKSGPAGSFDQDRVLNHGTVIYDEGKFRMWYGAAHRQPGVYWFRWMGTGYAESPDGLRWTKPCLTGSAEPSLNCNRQPLPWPCAVCKDPDDKNPAQRYKCVQFDRHQLQLMSSLVGQYDIDSPIGPGQLYQSADGLHWINEPVSITYPDGKPAELVVQSFFIDPQEPDPARRWKVYGYASLVTKRRAGCYAYSADGRHWTAYPRNPILDPTVSEVPLAPSGPIAQIHDTVVFPYRGYYLALFHAQHDANYLDVELAASRDGEHFFHVRHGHKVLGLGRRGAWDSMQILQTAPVVAHGKLWLYYGGQHMPAELAAKGEKNTELLQGGAGLATLRLDGFTHLAVKEGRSGTLTTVPIEISVEEPLSLVVNAECDAGGLIQVELLDAATMATISQSCLDSDKVRHVVGLGNLERAAGRKIVIRCRFESAGAGQRPRLYGFGFARREPGKE